MDTLQVTIDTVQTRLRIPSCPISLLGNELLGPGSLDKDNTAEFAVMSCPVTGTAHLRPFQLHPGWFNSNAGNYAKPTKAAGYEVTTDAKWFEPVIFTGAGSYLFCTSPSGEYARTDDTVGINRPIYLSYFGYGAGDVFAVLECGWSDSNSPTAETATIGLRIWSDGLVQIYKNGTLVGSGNISGATLPHTPENATKQTTPATISDKSVDLFIYPARRTDLVIYSGQGNGFVHTFEDLSQNTESNEITPDTKFFVVAIDAATLQLQFCPMTFPATGTIKSRPWQFPVPPQPEQTLWAGWGNPVFSSVTQMAIYGNKTYTSGPGGSNDVTDGLIRNVSDTANFVPDGVLNEALIKMTLTSGGKYTPWVWGMIAEFQPVSNETVATDTPVNEYIMSVGLEMPDDPFGLQGNLSLRMTREEVQLIDDDEDEETPAVATDVEIDLEDEIPTLEMSMRPITFDIGGVIVLDGFTYRPSIKDAIRTSLKRWESDVYDYHRLLESYQFRSRIPLDNFYVSDMVNYVLDEAGIFAGGRNISNINYRFSDIPSRNCDEWNEAIEIGDTGRQALEKIHRFVSDATYGPHPGSDGMEFWFLLPDDMPTTPQLTLYRTIQDAVDNGINEELAPDYLYHSWQEENLVLEANGVFATGINPQTRTIVQSYAVDNASRDPRTPPHERPENWAGYPLDLGVASRSFRDTRATDKAVEALIPIATQVQKVGQFQANTFLLNADGVPVWRFDMVELDGIGARCISSLSAQFMKEVTVGERGEGVTRSAMYTTGLPRGKGGRTLAEIQGAHEARMANRGIQQLMRAPLFATGVLASSGATF